MNYETEIAVLEYLKLASVWHYVLRAFPMKENEPMRELIEELQLEIQKKHNFLTHPLFEYTHDRWDHLTDELYLRAYPAVKR